MLVAWASLACTRDPYIDDVADIQDDLVETVDELLSEFETNSEQCGRSLFSTTACDRAIGNLEDMSVEARSARRAASLLAPPAEFAIWHRDYLSYLDDSAAVFDDTVSALELGDEDDFDRIEADMDSLSRREDALIERFEEIQ